MPKNLHLKHSDELNDLKNLIIKIFLSKFSSIQFSQFTFRQRRMYSRYKKEHIHNQTMFCMVHKVQRQPLCELRFDGHCVVTNADS